MPGTQILTRSGCIIPQSEQKVVQSSDTRTIERRTHAGELSLTRSAFFGVAICLLLGAALLGIFRLTTSNQYSFRPTGDATYFIEMTQVFYLNEPPAMQYPTMHSRRILGPWLAA